MCELHFLPFFVFVNYLFGGQNNTQKKKGGANMNAPQMSVKCSVENCIYNKDRACHARALEVNAMGDGMAQTSDGTCCTTFKQKNEQSFT